MTGPEEKVQVQRLLVQNLKSRLETGPMQVNADWTGVFIRGDDAFAFALQLTECLSYLRYSASEPQPLCVMGLISLLELLESANEQQLQECRSPIEPAPLGETGQVTEG